MKIFLISGKAGSGKDYFSKCMYDRIKDNDICIIPFSKTIKDFATKYCSWDGVKNEKGRELLINIGTYIGKGMAKIKGNRLYGYNDSDVTELYYLFTKYFTPNINIWSTLTKDYILYNLISDNEKIFIIPDNRFKDEIVYFKSIFGDDVVTIHINSNNRTQKINDISETGLDDYMDFDYEFNNDIDGYNFEKEINNIISKIKK